MKILQKDSSSSILEGLNRCPPLEAEAEVVAAIGHEGQVRIFMREELLLYEDLALHLDADLGILTGITTMEYCMRALNSCR